jgi:hypothetical protein
LDRLAADDKSAHKSNGEGAESHAFIWSKSVGYASLRWLTWKTHTAGVLFSAARRKPPVYRRVGRPEKPDSVFSGADFVFSGSAHFGACNLKLPLLPLNFEL